MKALLLLLIFAAGSPLHPPRVPTAACNAADHKIYAAKGKTFPIEFRKFGGLSVSKTAYEEAISEAFGLSVQCAKCYGEAYICGWNACRWRCALPSLVCDGCLDKAGCVSECSKCTGFLF